MSVFADGYKNVINRESRNLAEPVGDPTGFVANTVASFNQFVNEDLTISRMVGMRPELDDQFNNYQSVTGDFAPAQAYAIRTISASDAELFDKASKGDQQAFDIASKRQGMRAGWEAWQFWEQAANQYPDKIKTYDQMVDVMSGKLADERIKNEKVFRDANGWGKVGIFAGAMGGALTDPVNLATLGLGASVTMAKGLGTGVKLLELGAKNFAISASTEALIQPFVYDFKKEIGAKYTSSDAITNILAAGAGGAVFGIAPELSRVTYKGFKKNIDKVAFNLKSGINNKNITGINAKASYDAVKALQEVLEQNPFKEIDPSIHGVRAHLMAHDKAMSDFRNGNVADVSMFTKDIDETRFPDWQKLDNAKQILRSEIEPVLKDANVVRGDLNAINLELNELLVPGAIDKIKADLIKSDKLPARKAKAEAKQFVESRIEELTGRKAELDAELPLLQKTKDAERLIKKIDMAQNQGKSPVEIMEMIARERQDLNQPLPVPKKPERVKAQEPEVSMADEIDDFDDTYVAQERERVTFNESKTPEVKNVFDKANRTLYSDINDIDLINKKARQDVERLLEKEDILLPDEDGNLLSARRVIEEAFKDVESAAELKACFLS